MPQPRWRPAMSPPAVWVRVPTRATERSSDLRISLFPPTHCWQMIISGSISRRGVGLSTGLGFLLSMFAAWRSGLPGPLAVGGQVGPGIARLGVGQGLLVPVRVARGWEAEHRSLPGRGPLDDLEPV